jgi:hypothetical protein
MGLPHWYDAGSPWDKLVLGDNVMPGVWAIVSGAVELEIDTKKTKGNDKARVKPLGLLPPKIQAKGQIVSREDWEALQKIWPDIQPKKPGGPKFALKIYHPAAAFMGLTTVIVERVRSPEINNGICEITLDLIDWTETPKKTNFQKPKVPTSPTNDGDGVSAAELRGAGQWRTSTLRSANDPEQFNSVDADIAALSGRDYRNPPEFSAKDIDPSVEVPAASGLSL